MYSAALKLPLADCKILMDLSHTALSVCLRSTPHIELDGAQLLAEPKSGFEFCVPVHTHYPRTVSIMRSSKGRRVYLPVLAERRS